MILNNQHRLLIKKIVNKRIGNPKQIQRIIKLLIDKMILKM
jgi:hypothetical protein